MNICRIVWIKHFLWIPAIFLNLVVFAQGTATINGIVRDGTTQEPLAFVNVYFDNTTIGTSTNASGQYEITNIPTDLSELTFSYIGYSTIKVPNLKLLAGATITVAVKMVPSVVRLAPITITAGRRDDWGSKYKRFKDIFLGTTPNASKTEILNPAVLSFEEIKDASDADDFSARASGPLEIENRALGYHITVFLEDFKSIGSSYDITMTTKFDTLTPSSRLQERRWKENRLETYKGSQLQLFRTIANGTYEQEGFRIFSSSTPEASSRVSATLNDLIVDTTRAQIKILRRGIYQVHYYNKYVPFSLRKGPGDLYPVSTISVVDDYLRVYPNGQVRQPSNYWRSGYLYNFRFGDLLPSDYDPVVEEGRLTISSQRERSSLKGTVVDDHGNPLSNVEVFINNGMHHTTTNAWGKFELTNLYPGKYPIAFTYKEKEQHLSIIDLSQKNTFEMLVEMKDKSIQPSTIGEPVKDELHDAHVRLFWNLLLSGMGKWSFVITNPQVLQFVRQDKQIKVWCTSPLVIENRQLGYTWTYFISDATIKRKKLSISGLVRMDTIETDLQVERRRWENNRLDEWRGSWNHLITSLVKGQSETEGFKFYQLKQGLGKSAPRFENLNAEDVRSLSPDSILVAEKGTLFLIIPPGLEIHNRNTKPTTKFYKRQSSQVLRLTSHSQQVPITRTGSIDPLDLKISGQPHQSLTTVPLDHEFVADKGANQSVLLYVKEENLKAVKNLLEKVYIHTDRHFYYPGDTIWFKAYLRYSNLTYRDSLSNVLYADLLSPDGKVISSSLLKIEDGVAWGDLLVSSNIEPADYFLRIYTNWMRNFDEFMIRPLPIISRTSFIRPGNNDSTSTKSGDVYVTLSANKSIYGTRDSITLDVAISKGGTPVDANFSVTVTDQSIASDLEGVPNILSLHDPFKVDGANLIRLSYPMERGITLQGKIEGATEKSEYIVTTILLNGDARAVTPTVGPNFNVVLNFFDTTTALIQCLGKQDIPAAIYLLEKEPVDSYHLPDPLSYSLINDGTYVKGTNKVPEHAEILPEVTVGSRPISPPNVFATTSTEKKFGMAFQVFQGANLSNVRLTGDLLNYLAMRLPNFYETRCWIEYGQPCNHDTSSLDRVIPQAIPSRVYSLFLNGQRLDPSDFNIIPAHLVSRIEVYWAPGKNGNAVSIYTEPTFPHDERNFQFYKIKGYDKPHIFHKPSRERTEPDYRPTIYWNPSIKTTPGGKALISFVSSDVEGSYKVTIEGVTSGGEFFRATKQLNISK